MPPERPWERNSAYIKPECLVKQEQLHAFTGRPHLSYRNQGKNPIDTINEFDNQEAQEDI